MGIGSAVLIFGVLVLPCYHPGFEPLRCLVECVGLSAPLRLARRRGQRPEWRSRIAGHLGRYPAVFGKVVYRRLREFRPRQVLGNVWIMNRSTLGHPQPFHQT
jgi:hypothetical protein